ncbi:Glutamate/aspartate import solute-binding protein [Roseobacter fucihabitans]|uniref:Glutamate/aspartate import solute-binding protein n=1 Tax=Roseobacter fucihabitans TaxID=1537242 RepID=A0ABZ2BYS4_9RHOB|nr:amino acid ABC transporter substrate-binding protein [Roseobacter litoralis]MBC6964539.1 Glutamate/aspartate periplasmic-binding protein precursor [Roseobacter litoralis]
MRVFLALLIATLMMPLASQAQTLERIKSSGEIKFGYRTDAAPLSFENDAGRPQGYSPIVCFALAERLGAQLGLENLDVVFERVDTANRFDKVASGEIDLLCGASTITLSRREIVDFSVPTYVDGTTVLLQRDGVSGLSELSGKKVGVRGDTTTEQALNNSLQADAIDAEVITFSDHGAAMTAMENREIDGYFADQSILINLFINNPKRDQFKIFEGILTVEKHGFAMARGDTDFRLAVDTALSDLFQDGSMALAFEKALPGAEAGGALEALFLLSPTLP